MKKQDQDSEKKNGQWTLIDLAISLVLGYLTILFVVRRYEVGFDEMDRGLVIVPFLWLFLGPLMILSNKERLVALGFGWLFVWLKGLLLVGAVILILGVISMCADGSGLPDNIRF